MKKIAINLSNLSKSYKLYDRPSDHVKEVFSLSGKSYSKEKLVLDNIDIQIESGDVVGIVGTNGAGKSTLLKIITGVLAPTSGSAVVNGKIAALLELGTGFNPEFTGMKNIYLNGTMMGYSREEMAERVQDIIDFADIGDFIEQPVKTYSSGMFARLAFAVAINVEPEILIVDEALSVGDLRFQMKCMDKMKSMMDQGVTVLFVSHDINAIRRLCQKTIWLREGKVQDYGETNRVCDKYLDYLKLGEIIEDVENVKELEMTEKDETESILETPLFKEFCEGSKDGVAEIVGVRIINAQGKVVNEVNIFEPIKIEVYYDVYDEKIEFPVLGVALKRIDDEYICGVNTMLDQKKIPWKHGRNCYRLVYSEGIRTLGGRYYFDVALFDKTATVPIHYWAKMHEFSVTADYIGEGVCIIPHEWGVSGNC